MISDVHEARVATGSVPRVRSTTGEPGLLPAYRHLASDYLNATLPLGLRVRRCEEPRPRTGEEPASPEGDATQMETGPWDDWPWSLLPLVPAATRAAYDGLPATIIWHFQQADR